MHRPSRGVLAVAVALLLAHMLLAGRYGIFRDEMYYVACGEHLAFGYVDHPPLVALLARVAMAFGGSVYALRIIPALFAAGMIVLTGEAARAFGGGPFAQTLAALCVAVAPEMLGTFHFLSMNCVLPVAWTGALLLMLRALETKRDSLWIAFGVVCGLALLAKHSTLFFGAGLAAGLVATPHRAALRTRGPWLGVATAALLFAPNVAWEITHGWPTLEFMQNAQAFKMVQYGPVQFLQALALDMLPTTLPIWAGGVLWLLLAREARAFRLAGIAFVVLLAVVIAGHGKPYYVAGAFPTAFAAGGAAIEPRVVRPLLRGAIAALIGVTGLVIAPMAVPILAPAAFLRYAEALGVHSSQDEKHEMGPLPQHFADQFGWEAMAARVADAFARLSPEEKRVAAIFTNNYGEAGAVDYFGPRWGLPRAMSGHNAYFTWGPPESATILVTVGPTRAQLLTRFDDVEQVTETNEPYAMPYENHVPICIARRPKTPLRDGWPAMKHYN